MNTFPIGMSSDYDRMEKGKIVMDGTPREIFSRVEEFFSLALMVRRVFISFSIILWHFAKTITTYAAELLQAAFLSIR